jgi:hypothetical protein
LKRLVETEVPVEGDGAVAETEVVAEKTEKTE